jgi:hypothetical protein
VKFQAGTSAALICPLLEAEEMQFHSGNGNEHVYVIQGLQSFRIEPLFKSRAGREDQRFSWASASPCPLQARVCYIKVSDGEPPSKWWFKTSAAAIPSSVDAMTSLHHVYLLIFGLSRRRCSWCVLVVFFDVMALEVAKHAVA